MKSNWTLLYSLSLTSVRMFRVIIVVNFSASGYTGSDCATEIDECAVTPCQNNGTCHDGLGNYSCSCKYKIEKVPDGSNRSFETGFKGDNCEIDIDECATTPTICLNVAQCVNNHGSFKCFCGSDSNGIYFTGR